MDFDITGSDHVPCIRHILGEEIKGEVSEAVHQLFIVLKKAYDSVRREILFNILTELGVYMELVRLIQICLTETCSRVQVSKYLSDILSTWL